MMSLRDIPRPDRDTRKPATLVPSGAWDCHAHIYGLREKYPLWTGASYNPPVADVEDYRHMLEAVGIEHAVIVQPSAYGTDNHCTMDAVIRSNGAWRSVAVIDDKTTDAQLEEMNKVGFKGVRLHVFAAPDEAMQQQIERQAARVLPFGWHLQIFTESQYFPELFPQLDKIRNEIVVDHMGFVRGSLSAHDAGFQVLVARLREGRCWVKMSGAYRISRKGPPYDDARGIVEALLAANPDRLVFATDWPHPWAPDMTGPMPNDGDLVDQFAAIAQDEGLRRKIWVDNPARLYG